jgi:hypothetical protein
MSKQVTEYRQQTKAGEVRARELDLLVAVTKIVEQQRPSVEDLLAAVNLPWGDGAASTTA